VSSPTRIRRAKHSVGQNSSAPNHDGVTMRNTISRDALAEIVADRIPQIGRRRSSVERCPRSFYLPEKRVERAIMLGGPHGRMPTSSQIPRRESWSYGTRDTNCDKPARVSRFAARSFVSTTKVGRTDAGVAWLHRGGERSSALGLTRHLSATDRRLAEVSRRPD